MLNKKIGLMLICFLLTFSIISALEIEKETISSQAIIELDKPAIFNLKLTNTGEADTFTIYSLVGIKMKPEEPFFLDKGETRTIVLEAYPTLPEEYYSFEYKISGEKTGINVDKLAISIVHLKNAFDIKVSDINPESKTAKIYIENLGGHDLSDITIELTSPFFTFSETISIKAYEKKEFEADLKTDKMKELLAGPYIINTKVKSGEKADTKTIVFNFNEKAGIETKETQEGFIVQRYQIEKLNNGNTNSEVTIVISKNLISALFTSFNIIPNKKDFSGFRVNYIFQQELNPNKSLNVIAKTNWWILVLIIIGIVLVYYLIDKYIREKLVLTKRVTFVKTRGGEFALKVGLTVKARDYVEKIRVVDRLPYMVKIYEKFGLTPPDRVDERTKTMEWNINGMRKGEERSYSYIIYSKVGVVGRFELPLATALYEYVGKTKQASSNKAFFVNEPIVKKQSNIGI